MVLCATLSHQAVFRPGPTDLLGMICTTSSLISRGSEAEAASSDSFVAKDLRQHAVANSLFVAHLAIQGALRGWA